MPTKVKRNSHNRLNPRLGALEDTYPAVPMLVFHREMVDDQVQDQSEPPEGHGSVREHHLTSNLFPERTVAPDRVKVNEAARLALGAYRLLFP